MRLYVKKPLVLCFAALALNGFSQRAPNPVGKNKEAIIAYKATISKSGYGMTLADTLLVRDFFVLEPIKKESTKDESSISDRSTKLTSSNQELQWYYLTDVSKMVGMGFNVKTQPTRKNIKTFTSKSKDLGYGLSAEPFLFKNGYRIGDYSRSEDTIYNGQKCFVVKTGKKIPVVVNSSDDELLFTRMIINPGIKGQHYSFISDVIAQHFGGAIVFAESGYKSSLNVTIKFEYKTELTSAYSKIFDKYQSLYFANARLLD